MSEVKKSANATAAKGKKISKGLVRYHLGKGDAKPTGLRSALQEAKDKDK